MVWLNSARRRAAFGFGLGDALLSLRSRLAAFVGAARRQQFINLTRALINLLSLRQFIARQRISGDRPEVTALFAERVFEQQRVGVELR